MKYIESTKESFAEYLKSTNCKIVLFGAGAVCRTFVSALLADLGLSDRVVCVIDNNPAKQGESIAFKGNLVDIVSADILFSLSVDYCVLITNGDFYTVINQLDRLEECRDKCCFIAAYMQLENPCDRSGNSVYKDFGEPVIPKIIHYCWFSGNPVPPKLQRCLDTWKEQCPDYDIVRWDETNFDLNRYQYTKEAAELKKWGYIPDVVRLCLLYEIGGFYFDTDVEMLKSLDDLRYQEAFCGRERMGHVNFGGGSGAAKGNQVIKELLDFRKDIPFIAKHEKGIFFNAEASGYYETTPLMHRGLIIDDTNQKLDGINVYSSEFFSPYNFISGEDIRNHNTFSVHHFGGSWLEGGDKYRKETRDKYYVVREKFDKLS